MAIISLSSLELVVPTALNSSYTAGATLANGDVVYSDVSDGSKVKLADNTTLAKAAAVGIVMIPTADTQACVVAVNNTILKSTGTFTKGAWYYLSSTAGDIELETDLSASDYITQVGYARTADELVVSIVRTGVQK